MKTVARIGRPPMSEDDVRARVDAYCARYGVKDRNDAGFPVYPAGRRETAQHRDWVTLFKLFERHRKRAGHDAPDGDAACPVCLRPLGARRHRRCDDAVSLVRELGPGALDRLRALAAPTGPGTSPKRKA